MRQKIVNAIGWIAVCMMFAALGLGMVIAVAAIPY